MAAGDNPTYNYQPRSGNLGSPTWFQPNSYSVENLMYPDDLMSPVNNQYGGNFVIFYINVHEDSLLFKGSTPARTVTDIPPNMRGEVSGQFTDAEVVAGVATAGALGQSLTTTTGSTIAKATLGVDNWAIETGANLVGGAIAGGVVLTALGGVSGRYKRLESAIALHVPPGIEANYSVNWQSSDMAMMSAATTAGESMGKAMSELMSGNISQSMSNVENAGGAGISYLVGQTIQKSQVGEFLGKSTGTAANPKKEQMFRNVDFRTFRFNYQFFPRSPDEAKKIRAIINAFKLHMHPEFKDASHFLYTYPSEFDIYYYQNNVENMNLHRHTSCVLTDMSVSYSSHGVVSMFDDGMPTQINVALQFKELALLTKESIRDGY